MQLYNSKSVKRMQQAPSAISRISILSRNLSCRNQENHDNLSWEYNRRKACKAEHARTHVHKRANFGNHSWTAKG